MFRARAILTLMGLGMFSGGFFVLVDAQLLCVDGPNQQSSWVLSSS